MQKARWVFLKAFLLVAGLVVVTGIGLEQLLENRDFESIEERERALMLGNFLYADRLLPLIDSNRLAEQQALIRDELRLPAALHRLHDFAALGETYDALLENRIVLLFDGNDERVFYRRLRDTDWVVALGPAPRDLGERTEWIVPLFYGLIALAVFLWVRPLSRDLDKLQASAQSFGRQDFSTRVTIPRSSWLEPLGSAFNSMAERIQWLLQSHRELTHAVSHELRTPLARLRFSLEMLEGATAEDRKRHCESMNRDVEELNELIEEMLSYAELNQDNLTARREPLDIGPWLDEYVSTYNTRGTGISVDADIPDDPVSVMVDARLIRRALDNLLGNALRYARTHISVRLLLGEDRCEVHVIDDGPGIPEQKRQAVLTAYTRLEPSRAEVSHGFGLGLAIVKRIMDLHDGEIRIGSAAVGGADIALSWPR